MYRAGFAAGLNAVRAVIRDIVTPATTRRLASACMLLGWLCVAFAATDLDRMAMLALQRYGPQGQETLLRWRSMIEQSRDMSEYEQLEAVNAFFNSSIAFEDDIVSWGVSDYWATPLETLGKGQGDCEDFSIGKYVTLGMLGMPIEKLRITYVRAEMGLQGSGVRQAHMVLAYYEKPGAEPIILDNLVSQLRPASRRPDLSPVFGFNSQGLWVAGSRAPAVADPSSRLSRWRDLLRRMNEEGLN
jgi:predicted transglutaminase-like cysteine proteinase